MATTSSTGPTRNPHVRDRILASSLRLARRVGYPALTIEAIARDAGVGKQTIYRWWRSKGAVLLDALARDRLGENELPDTGDLRADVEAVLLATAAELRDPTFDALLRALTQAVLADEDLAREYRERLDGPMRAAKRRRLQAAQVAGQIGADVDLDVAVDHVFGPLAQRWMFRLGPIEESDVRHLAGLAVDGLGGAAGASIDAGGLARPGVVTNEEDVVDTVAAAYDVGD